MDLKESAFKILNEAVDAVKPDKLLKNHIRLKGNTLLVKEREFDLSIHQNIYVVGAGKASAFMAHSLEQILGNKVMDGAVVVKYEHDAPCKNIRIFEGGHPIIDENCLSGTRAIFELLERTTANDLVICLISGGGSALLEKLPPSITLQDLQETSQLLLECGAAIEEINTVRKHLSEVKGGQLARRIFPSRGISLIISDVIGDPLESIASGPTTADTTTFNDAWEITEKYRLQDKVPEKVSSHLQLGIQGKVNETLKPGDPALKNISNIILGNNLLSLKSAEAAATNLGFNTLILSSRIQGEAREVARVISGIAQEIMETNLPVQKPACILLGGETTVTIRGKGKGGRNQELALASLMAMRGSKSPYFLVSCGTDGTDGPTDAAGGIASAEILKSAQNLNLKPQTFLDQNDSYNFLRKVDGLINTGPTGTNVMDIVFALIP
jgi:glycerate-2-kinase